MNASIRFFVFLYVDDPEVESMLNLAIYTANPEEKWPAHVTVAGPYKNPPKAIKEKIKFFEEVSVCGVGQFRSQKQNTVFLRVMSPNLKNVWHKPDFGFNPHITIYDGSDVELADKIYKSLESMRPEFTFFVRELSQAISVKGQKRLDLFASLNDDMLRRFNFHDFGEIPKLKNDDRVGVITSAVRSAMSIANSKIRHNAENCL